MAARFNAGALIRDGVRAVLAALGQLALAGNWRSGLLVLAGIGVLSPLAATMATAGAALGTAFAWASGSYDRAGRSAGLAGFNGAVVGLFWAGPLAAGDMRLPLLIGSFGLCCALEPLCRAVLAALRLPAMVLPAVLTLWGVSMLEAPAGGWFWLDPPLNIHPLFVVASTTLILIAVALEARRRTIVPAAATLLALAASAGLTSFAGPSWLDVPILSLIGFWGLNVPLAALAVAGVFLRNCSISLALGLLAGALAAIFWCVWWVLGGPFGQPPLMAPYLFSVWLSLILARPLSGFVLLQHEFWMAAVALVRARLAGEPVALLLEAGVPWDPTITDPNRWIWLDPSMPRRSYSVESFRGSGRCRRAYWEACDRLRRHPAARRTPIIGYADIIFDADPRAYGASGSPPPGIAIRGSLGEVSCLDCGRPAAWPPRGIWRLVDLHCSVCRGFLKPAVHILPEDAQTVAIPDELLPSHGALILCGPISSDPNIVRILERVRHRQTRVFQLIACGASYPSGANDRVVVGDPCRLLSRLLGAVRLAQHFARRRHPSKTRTKLVHSKSKGYRLRPTLWLGSVGALALVLSPWADMSHAALDWLNAWTTEEITIPSYAGGWIDDIRTGRYLASPLTLTGRLYLPKKQAGRVPAAVLLHGSDGVSDLQERYAARLASYGIAALVVDSFRARGIHDTVANQSAISAYTMTIDAYQALRRLAHEPHIDASRVAVIGWSKGGLAADFASRTWYQVHLSRSDLHFAAHVAFYSWCGEQPLKPQQTGAPLLYLLGGRDDWTGGEACERYVDRLREAGYPARAVVYRNAQHAFDADGYFQHFIPQADRLSNCAYTVETDGFRDLHSGELRRWSSFAAYFAACSRKGAHVGSNAVAREDAWRELRSFLARTIG